MMEKEKADLKSLVDSKEEMILYCATHH